MHISCPEGQLVCLHLRLGAPTTNYDVIKSERATHMAVFQGDKSSQRIFDM